MEVYGVFSKFKNRDNKTGDSCFTLRLSPESRYIVCLGIVIPYSSGTPLKLTGEYRTVGDRTYFYVSKANAFGYSRNDMAEFLAGRKFSRIGNERALKVLDITGTDIFGYIRNGAISDNKDVKKIVSILRGYTELEDLYEFILGCNGDYHAATTLYESYNSSAMDIIKNNAYKLLSAGINYNVCEGIARKMGVEQCDPQRVSGIVRTAIETSRGVGNTRITFHELCNYVNVLEKNARCGYYTSPIFVAEEVYKKYRTEEVGNELYIYTRNDYRNEDIIVKNVTRLKTSAENYGELSFSIEEIEKKIHTKYSKEQEDAFNLLKSSGIKIITGGPGTGKTTVVKGLIEGYKIMHPDKAEILLLAPTGCAAKRLRESTDRDAFTIHSALGLLPYKTDLTISEQLSQSLIIIDEFSMVDTELASLLLASIKNGATVIIVGDSNQLASVGNGDVLRDFIASGVFEHYCLTQIFRQGERSLIIDNSHKIINGDTHLMTDNTFKIYRYDTEKEVVDKALSVAAACYKHRLEFKLYTPARKSKIESGANKMNLALRNIHRKYRDDYDFEQNIHSAYSVGDRVMFTKNSTGKYYNGEEGVVVEIGENRGKTQLTILADEEEITITGNEINNLELAYAITAHKSQGGECDNAVILVPKHPMSLLKRQLLYVEVTRARKGIIIISEGNALEQCISTFGECTRQTGLVGKLQK